MNQKSSSDRESGQFVFPGKRLGVIEEFVADTGTYVQDGIIYSTIVGRALLDLLNKRVSVYPLVQMPKVPRIGSTTLGQVLSVQKQNASIRIHQIGGTQLSGFFTGLLHVSDVQSRYVESMYSICKPGDTIKAKVISEKNGTYHLSVKDRDLGVVHAFCSRCGYVLERKQYRMRCARCGKIEKRKTALDYGKEVMMQKGMHDEDQGIEENSGRNRT